MAKLTLTSVKIVEDGGSGGDNVVIRVQSDGGAPARFPRLDFHTMNNSSSVWSLSPNPVYYFNHTCYVSLWDKDVEWFNLSDDDFLGDCFFKPGQDTSEYVTVYGSDGAIYQVYYTLTDDSLPAANSQAPDSTLIGQAQSALQEWKNSPDGQTVMSYTDPESIFDIVKDALVSTAFSDLIETAKGKINIKAVSLGLLGNADIFAGISGGFGAVMDILTPGSDVVMYALGGVTEGVDEGFDGGIAFGFWYEDVASVGGIYFGGGMEADDGVGFDGAAFCKGDDRGDYRNPDDGSEDAKKINKSVLKVAFMSADVGGNDGVEGEEAYIFAGDVGADLPCYQTGDYIYAIRLNKIECKNAESAGKDNDCCRIIWSPDYDGDGLPLGGDDGKFVYPMVNSVEMDDDSDSNIHNRMPGTIMRFNSTLNIGFFEGKDSEGISILAYKTLQVSDFTSGATAAVGDTYALDFMNSDTESNSSIVYKLHFEVVAVTLPDD